MADPLTQVTEQFAPAPLNFFDQNRAQSIIARHADSRRGLESANAAFDSYAQVEQLKNNRAREERAALLQTREDREYADKMANREDRSSFFDDLDEFDHTATNANTKLTETLKTIAKNTPTLLEDPVSREFIERKFRQIDKHEAQRLQNDEIKLRQKNTLDLVKERDKFSPLLSNLTPEDHAEAPKDVNGEPLREWLVNRAWENKSKRDLDTYDKKTDIRKDAMKELLDNKKMDAAQKAIFEETEKFVIGDKNAFPDQLDAVRAAAVKKGYPDAIRMKPEELSNITGLAPYVSKAVAWEKDKFKNEVRTAKAAKTPEEYNTFSDPYGNPAELTPEAKAARLKVWEYAHQNDAAEAALSGKPAPTAAPSGAAPKYVKKNGKWYKVTGE